MKIYLDTNAFSKVGHNFSKTQYIKIAKLCTFHGYSVVLHEIAKREFETQICDELKADVEKLISASARISRKLNSPDLKKRMSDESEFFTEHRNILLSDKLQPFHKWLEVCHADVLLISKTNISSIFDDYFTGNGAFSCVKSRNDIPDAFILEGLMSLKDDPDGVVAVCDDGRLNKAMQSLGFAKIFSRFDDFLNSDIVKGVEFDFSVERLLATYGDTVFEKITSDASFMAFLERSVSDYDWEFFALDEESEADPRIVGCDHFYNFKAELVIASGNQISVRCTFDVDAEIEYYIYKSDMFCMSDDKFIATHLEDRNKHYFLASTSSTISFEVECSVYVDEDFSFSFDSKIEDITADMLEHSSCEIEDISHGDWAIAD